jgi:membrane-bound ClpP family serine protease
VQHVEPLTHELALLHSRSSPDVSRLENIADRSKSFKHHDLDATLLQTTEVKHGNGHRLYWYITIPVLAAILMTIVICNTYPFF